MLRGTVKSVSGAAITIARDGSTVTMPVSYWLPGSYPLVGDRVLFDTTDGEVVVFGNLTGGNAITGEVKTFSFKTLDPGFVLADGSSLLRTDYPRLNAKYSGDGYPFGTADGTHFNLPDLTSAQQMVLPGPASVLGNVGGSSAHTHAPGSYVAQIRTNAADNTMVANMVNTASWTPTDSHASTGTASSNGASRTTGANVNGTSAGPSTGYPPFIRLVVAVRT